MLNKVLKDQRGFVTTAIAFVICVVFFITFVVGSIEYFLPLQKNNQFKEVCRSTLYKMELMGYLDVATKNTLNSKLSSLGLVSESGGTTDYVTALTTNVRVKQGSNVRLNVKAKFTYSKLSFLLRANKTENFTYDRTMVRRTITN